MKVLLPHSDQIEQADIPAALAALAALQGQLAARLLMAPPTPASEPTATRDSDDDLLDTTQAAAMLKCSAKWLYRHAQELSAVRRGAPAPDPPSQHDAHHRRRRGGEYLWSRRAINRWLARHRA